MNYVRVGFFFCWLGYGYSWSFFFTKSKRLKSYIEAAETISSSVYFLMVIWYCNETETFQTETVENGNPLYRYKIWLLCKSNNNEYGSQNLRLEQFHFLRMKVSIHMVFLTIHTHQCNDLG